MPCFCCAFGCRSRYFSGCGKSFHRLPKETTLRQAWVARISRADWCPVKTSVLCSDHFTADCFIEPAIPGFFSLRRLKPDAVPTVFNLEQPLEPVARKKRRIYADLNWLDEVCYMTQCKHSL